jgi:hypothetical protein
VHDGENSLRFVLQDKNGIMLDQQDVVLHGVTDPGVSVEAASALAMIPQSAAILCVSTRSDVLKMAIRMSPQMLYFSGQGKLGRDCWTVAAGTSDCVPYDVLLASYSNALPQYVEYAILDLSGSPILPEIVLEVIRRTRYGVLIIANTSVLPILPLLDAERIAANVRM